MERLDNYVGVTLTDFFKTKIEREISFHEILLLNHIEETFQFEDGVVNLLIEQILMMNDNQLTRGITLKLANEWHQCSFETLAKAIEYADAQYEKFLHLQQRDNYGEIRELTKQEKEIVNRIFYRSSLNEEVLDAVLSYCMKINDGYVISWFINRLIDFLTSHNVSNKQEANKFISLFHENYVVSFGMTK